MAKHFIIYETKNLKNGKTYIGMHETDNLNDGYLGSGYHFKRAVRYYGKEFFERKILFDFDNREDMINKEIELVNDEFIARQDTYNLMKGGKGGLYTLENCIKGGHNSWKTLREKWKNDDFRKLQSSIRSKTMSNNLKEGKIKRYDWSGKHHSEETKDKIKNSMFDKQTGEKNSQFGTMWIHNSEINKNKKIKKNEVIPEGWTCGRKIKK